jgi:phosphoglycerate dehydrogenase-like enzyme
VAALRRDFPDVEVVDARTDAERLAALPDAEIVFSWSLGEEATAAARRLRWLHAPSAGVGAFLTPSLRALNPAVTNSRGVHAVPIAEHVLGMLVALVRRFRASVVEQTTTGMRRETWWIGPAIPDELCGRTLGLFGYGAIGREVARRALACGMRVLPLRRHPGRAPAWDPALLAALGLPLEEPAVEPALGPGDLGRLLAESDAIVICAALTGETEGVFDAEALARMKPGAHLVNIARGKIVRESALVDALRSGRLDGAALDVFEREPLPPDSPLYTLENVLLTPHVSGLSRGFWPRAMRLFRANLERDGTGLPLLNRVDVARGY